MADEEEKKEKFHGKCMRCGKRGHPARECPTRPAVKERERQKVLRDLKRRDKLEQAGDNQDSSAVDIAASIATGPSTTATSPTQSSLSASSKSKQNRKRKAESGESAVPSQPSVAASKSAKRPDKPKPATQDSADAAPPKKRAKIDREDAAERKLDVTISALQSKLQASKSATKRWFE